MAEVVAQLRAENEDLKKELSQRSRDLDTQRLEAIAEEKKLQHYIAENKELRERNAALEHEISRIVVGQVQGRDFVFSESKQSTEKLQKKVFKNRVDQELLRHWHGVIKYSRIVLSESGVVRDSSSSRERCVPSHDPPSSPRTGHLLVLP